jgi:hypothetical protein
MNWEASDGLSSAEPLSRAYWSQNSTFPDSFRRCPCSSGGHPQENSVGLRARVRASWGLIINAPNFQWSAGRSGIPFEAWRVRRSFVAGQAMKPFLSNH